jgi:hypothetical protein
MSAATVGINKMDRCIRKIGAIFPVAETLPE